MPGLIRVVIGLLLCVGAAGAVDNPETNVWRAIAIVMVGVSITLWGAYAPMHCHAARPR